MFDFTHRTFIFMPQMFIGDVHEHPVRLSWRFKSGNCFTYSCVRCTGCSHAGRTGCSFLRSECIVYEKGALDGKYAHPVHSVSVQFLSVFTLRE
jgi:hypothetical protein